LDKNILKVVFMGTPDFAVPVLAKLISSGYHIVSVISQPDRPQGRKHVVEPNPVKKSAMEFGLAVYQPVSLRDEGCVKRLQDLAPDVIVVAAYGNMLTKEVLKIPRFGCINVHASLLPDLRGAAPIQYALLRGYQKTGISIMQMEAGLDSGPVFAQNSLAIAAEDDAQSLSVKLSHLGAALLLETLPDVIGDQIKPLSQDETGASYAPKIARCDEIIDWNLSSSEIHNHIRAMSPSPGALTRIAAKNLKIYRSNVCQIEGLGRVVLPGEVVRIERDGITVACGAGFLNILDLQIAGKKRLSVAEFVGGAFFKAGDCFEQKSMVANEA
jgi:methionyl-tRNA formyltransferase